MIAKVAPLNVATGAEVRQILSLFPVGKIQQFQFQIIKAIYSYLMMLLNVQEKGNIYLEK